MRAPDPVLHMVVQLAERGLSITATISVQGAVISGRIISRQHFVVGLRQRFNAQVHEENLPGLNAFLQLLEETSTTGGDAFIHFKDAVIATGSGPKERVIGFWRVHLSAVDGFSFGM